MFLSLSQLSTTISYNNNTINIINIIVVVTPYFVYQDVVMILSFLCLTFYKIVLFMRYAADGNRREGQWIDDQLHGFVTFTCKSCNTKNRGNLRRENGSDQSKQIDVTKIERWRKGRRISDGVSERSPLVNLFDR